MSERERYTFTLHKEIDAELYKFLKDKSITKIAKIALEDYRKKVLGKEGKARDESSSSSQLKKQMDSDEVRELAQELAKVMTKQLTYELQKIKAECVSANNTDDENNYEKEKLSKSALDKLDSQF